MSEPFISEIRILAFTFPPKGWAFCNGQLLPINQNQALFSLLGTNYGGDGRQTFGLPNLQGRAPIHTGNGFVLGQFGGETTHTLTAAEANHQHPLNASINQATSTNPSGNVLTAKKRFGANAYQSSPTGALDPSSVSTVTGGGANGGADPHQNMQPYLVLNFAIALNGIFPTQN
jgi:microcystin-dependent protein